MSGHLQFENNTLRRQLESLLQEARQNETKQRRFDSLERRLIVARNFHELVRLLLTDYRTAFNIEQVTLVLLDPDGELAQILGDERPAGLRLQDDVTALADIYGADLCTRLCAYEARSHAALFDAADGEIASVALLPLLRAGTLIGSLNLGSIVVERYDPDAGTKFLDRLAAVVAICIDNALAHERLKHAGLTDVLTGVQNRRYFEHRSLAEVCQAVRRRQSLACMFLDIDHFKRINDTHGHQSGDEVLRAVAGVIQSQLRAGDMIARYGGEEFVALLPQTAAAHAQEIAERIRAAISGTRIISTDGESVPVTISIGLAMLDEHAANDEAGRAAALLAAADAALYEAKRGGRNRVVGTFSRHGMKPVRPAVRHSWPDLLTRAAGEIAVRLKALRRA